LRLTCMEEGLVEAEIEVVPALMNAKGTLYGGVPAGIADALAIYGAVVVCKAAASFPCQFECGLSAFS
jgi:acyl-coenzyme A thioesterase PaaI-like protein